MGVCSRLCTRFTQAVLAETLTSSRTCSTRLYHTTRQSFVEMLRSLHSAALRNPLRQFPSLAVARRSFYHHQHSLRTHPFRPLLWGTAAACATAVAFAGTVYADAEPSHGVREDFTGMYFIQ